MSTSFKGFQPWAAKKFGLEAAVVLEEALRWDELAIQKRWNEHEGRAWFYHSRQEWAECLPFINEHSLPRYLTALVKAKILLVRYGQHKRPFYAVDRKSLQKACEACFEDSLPKPFKAAAPVVEPEVHIEQSARYEPPESYRAICTIWPVGFISCKLISISDGFARYALSLEKQIKEQINIAARADACDAADQLIHYEAIELNANALEKVEEPPDPSEPSSPPSKAPPRPRKSPSQAIVETTSGTKVWQAYSEAYERRYGVAPSASRATARHAKELAESMPLEEAIGVAHFYLTSNGQWYVQKGHDLRWAAQDCQTLRTQMLTGQRMTGTRARQMDKDGALGDVAERALLRAKQRAAERIARGEPE